jgi:putative ABC transport system substrate-binding protein
MPDMGRREFITLLGGAAAAWPLAAHTQATGKVAKLGILAVARTSPATRSAYEILFAELRTHGFIQGDNLISEITWIDEDLRGPSVAAAEMARSNIDVLVIEGPEDALRAATIANPGLPIVVYANNYDPIERGYAKSLSRPGGNVTGVFTRQPELAEKQLELLTQAFPAARRLATLSNAESVEQFNAAQRRAKLRGLEIIPVELQKLPYDINAAFQRIIEGRAELIQVLSGPAMFPYRFQIIELAAQHRLPTMFIFRSYVLAGGLMSYGANRAVGMRPMATYVAKILKGAKPSDLPLDQPTKYELTINLSTAKAIGVEIPTAILLRADEVIE